MSALFASLIAGLVGGATATVLVVGGVHATQSGGGGDAKPASSSTIVTYSDK